MDSDMRQLWQSMGPLPGDLRLYGGTALALYLNHRQSTDFDFATPLPIVDPEFVSALPWMKHAILQGGPGMVDAVIEGKHRKLNLTFMETGRLIPLPSQNPLKAPNGVAVAHPEDLVAAKMEACISRGMPRDYQDIVAAFSAWPGLGKTIMYSLPTRSVSSVGRALASPPADVEAVLDPQSRHQLHQLARQLADNQRDFDR